MSDLPDGPDADILDGAARMLNDADIGLTYLTDDVTPYPDDAIAVVLGIMPEAPDRCVALNWASLSDEVEMSSGSGLLQCAIRGRRNDARDVANISSAIRGVLHNQTNVTFGTVTVDQMYRQTSVPMGQDDNDRLERADHYYLDVEYPPNPNIPE